MSLNEPAKNPSSGAGEVWRACIRLGCTAFGGPAAHIGYFRREFVERRNWLTAAEFGQLLALSQFLPGPSSSQLCFAVGLLRAGWAGALAAFVGFTLPAVLLMLAFAASLPTAIAAGSTYLVHGLKLVACIVVADAVIKMFIALCPDWRRRGFALLALGGALFSHSALAQMACVAAGAGAGLCFLREPGRSAGDVLAVPFGLRVAALPAVVFVSLLIALPLLSAQGITAASIANAFYRTGALVFGGGHVVLPWLENAVVAPGWVDRTDFLAGYGAAQAIPGPLFAFAAFLGATMDVGLHPGVAVTLAVTTLFLPGFLLLLAALPVWRALSTNRHANRAMAGVNAAVVGILAATWYDPLLRAGITDAFDVAIMLTGLLLLQSARVPLLLIVAGCIVLAALRAWSG